MAIIWEEEKNRLAMVQINAATTDAKIWQRGANLQRYICHAGRVVWPTACPLLLSCLLTALGRPHSLLLFFLPLSIQGGKKRRQREVVGWGKKNKSLPWLVGKSMCISLYTCCWGGWCFHLGCSCSDLLSASAICSCSSSSSPPIDILSSLLLSWM